ncbi:hypothetical protein N665_0116s0175, partial [Sinapis alba]
VFLSAIQQFSFYQRLSDHFTSFFSPYVEINFPHFQGLHFNQAYSAINAYLGSKGTDKSNRLSASQGRDTKGLALKREDTIMNDEYKGFKNKKLFSNAQSMWRYIEFKHPTSFQTLAMDPEKKQLGTKNNSDLKKLLTTTSSKSIIVIEDIDCSVHLTGNRFHKDNNLRKNEEQRKEENSVTLSGLLNFIAESSPLFDDHHPLFDRIKSLLKETMITQADLAENLMARNQVMDVDSSLNNLIQTLERMNISIRDANLMNTWRNMVARNRENTKYLAHYVQ